jgi:hypothetical protein
MRLPSSQLHGEGLYGGHYSGIREIFVDGFLPPRLISRELDVSEVEIGSTVHE